MFSLTLGRVSIFFTKFSVISSYVVCIGLARQTDVLILNAQNLNKFRFQIKYFVCNENVLSKE